MFTKKYLQDRPILFLNVFVVAITLLNLVSGLLRIDTGKNLAIVRYKVAEGLDGYERADPYYLYNFIIVALVLAGVGILLSTKLYKQKRFMSIMLLSLTAVVLVFNFIVSTAIYNLQ